MADAASPGGEPDELVRDDLQLSGIAQARQLAPTAKRSAVHGRRSLLSADGLISRVPGNTDGMMMIKYLSGTMLVAALAVAGCSSETTDSVTSDLRSAATAVGDAAGEATNDAAESVVRNIATQQGEEQFKNAGQELDGPLTCTTKVADGVDKIDVECTGTTKAGGAAMLTGTTSEIPGASVVELEGNFVGTVDGSEVFTTQSLGG